MARPKNPLGDPVRLYRDGDYLRIRFYPSGVITSPDDRVRFEGRWLASCEGETRAANEVAARLRSTLLTHRAAHGASPVSGDQVITVRQTITAFLDDLAEKPTESRTEDPEEAPTSTPTGTIKARRSQLFVNIPAAYLDEPIEILHGHADEIVNATRTALKADGTPKAENTKHGARSALAEFGKYLAAEHNMLDPFKAPMAVQEDPRKAKRAKALAKVHRTTPTFRGSNGVDAIDPKQLPTYEQVAALRDAIVRRETQGPPGRPASGRGCRGGASVLPLEVASVVADSVIFSASTGLRGLEMLAAHTSRVDLRRGTIIVDRQLDRYLPWLPGQDPPLVPPKHNVEREVTIWSSFDDNLRYLVDYANGENGGWIFAPTRGQTDWPKSYSDLIDRARDLMAFEFNSAVAAGEGTSNMFQWTHTMHWLRHFYASQSLAPVSANGLGWSLGFVQRNLGHQSEKTTENTYRHITEREREAARKVHHTWPGLKSVDDVSGVALP